MGYGPRLSLQVELSNALRLIVCHKLSVHLPLDTARCVAVGSVHIMVQCTPRVSLSCVVQPALARVPQQHQHLLAALHGMLSVRLTDANARDKPNVDL